MVISFFEGLSLSDFVKLPDAFKYVLLFIVLIGTAIPLPFADFSIGDIIFEPFKIGFGAVGIFVNFQMFFILIVFTGVIMFMLALNKG